MKFLDPCAGNRPCLLQKVRRTVEKNGLFATGDRILAAVSGGPDSMALAFILSALAPDYELKLGIAHFHHGLRKKTAELDAALVEKTAGALNLPFFYGEGDVPTHARKLRLSTEEAGRELRYAFLEKTASDNGYGVIALGHHCQDNAEQVLMNLIRGSGPLGLAGIPVSRGVFVRPLMDLEKGEILSFCQKRGIQFRFDESNFDSRYLRNRVRNELLPFLTSRFNPNLVQTLGRNARVLGREERWLSRLEEEAESRCMAKGPDGMVSLNPVKLKAMDPALQCRMIRRAVIRLKKDLKRITACHVEAVLELLESGKKGRGMDLPGKIRAEMKKESLIFFKKSLPKTETFSLEILSPGSFSIPMLNSEISVERISPQEAGSFFGISDFTAVLDEDRASFPFLVRPFFPGDLFTPLGCSGKQKLKKFFIDHKVPKEERNRILIFESRGRIVWVAGYRIDHGARILPGTKKALKLEVFLA